MDGKVTEPENLSEAVLEVRGYEDVTESMSLVGTPHNFRGLDFDEFIGLYFPCALSCGLKWGSDESTEFERGGVCACVEQALKEEGVYSCR